MRIAFAKSLLFTADRLDTVVAIDHWCIGLRRFDEPIGPGIELQSVQDYDIGVFDGDHVVGRGFEIVRIGVRRQDRLDLDSVATELAREIGQDARRRHDLQRSVTGVA